MTLTKKIVLTLLSFVLFWGFSSLGYLTGDKVAYQILFDFFGYPQDLYVFLFAIVTYLSSVVFGFIGALLGLVVLHQIGRRLKLAVGKPTLYGFLLYLLTLLILIIRFNQTH